MRPLTNWSNKYKNQVTIIQCEQTSARSKVNHRNIGRSMNKGTKEYVSQVKVLIAVYIRRCLNQATHNFEVFHFYSKWSVRFSAAPHTLQYTIPRPLHAFEFRGWKESPEKVVRETGSWEEESLEECGWISGKHLFRKQPLNESQVTFRFPVWCSVKPQNPWRNLTCPRCGSADFLSRWSWAEVATVGINGLSEQVLI